MKETIKRIQLDIMGVLTLAILSILITSTLLTERTDTPPIEAVVAFWLLTISNAALAYGRNRIEVEHYRTYKQLGEPYSIFRSFWSRSYWKFLKHVFTFEFLGLNDKRITTSFSAFLILTAICILLIASI